MTKKKKEVTADIVAAPKVAPVSSNVPAVYAEMEIAMERREPGYDQLGSALLPDQEPVLIIKGEKRTLTKAVRPELHYHGHHSRTHEGYCEDKYRPVEEWWKYERANLTIYMTRGSVIDVKQLQTQSSRLTDKCTMTVDQSYIKAETLSIAADTHVQVSKLVTEGFLLLGLARIHTTSLTAQHRVALNNLELYESNIRVESCNLRDSTLNKARIWARKANVSANFGSVFDTTLSVANTKHIIIGTDVRKLDFNNYNFDGTIMLEHRTHYGSFGTAEANFVHTMSGILFSNFEIKRLEWLGSDVLTDENTQLPVPTWNAFQPLPTTFTHIPTNTTVFWKLLAAVTGNYAIGYKQGATKVVKPNQMQRSLVDQISAQITSRLELWQTITSLKEAVIRPDIGEFHADY